MELNEIEYTGELPIDGYGNGFFRIGGQPHFAPLVVLPSGVEKWGGFDDYESLLAAKGKIDVLLIGTGPQIAHIPNTLRDPLEAAGIGVEVMASSQACRTYNVLLGEGRRVAVALLSATDE